jgi:hypothetical protein
MKRVLVFCGSSPGARPEYTAAGTELGRLLAERGLGLVYGGASVGVMSAVADSALEGGGEVIGVIPRLLLEREIAHTGLSDLRIVETMHARKELMADLSDAVIALPGGTGTMDELFEMFTWSQLGLHRKPIGLLDVAGYWGGLLAFLDHMVDERFLWGEQRDTLLVEREPEVLLDRCAAYVPRMREKWVDAERSVDPERSVDGAQVLLRAADAAMRHAYAPYSQFKVGAAVRAPGGAIYTGANVENVAFPQGACAEASALGALVTAGETAITEVAVVAERVEFCPPCGGCRQRLAEFGDPSTPVHLGRPGDEPRTMTLAELLPGAFGRGELES